jgi:hypothetical protein
MEPDPRHSDLDPPHSSEQAYRWQNDWRLISCTVAVVALVLAVVRQNGDGFYTFLRIYVFGLALLLAVVFARQRYAIWAVAAVLTAILFNPIIPIEMYREDWMPYDLVAAAGFSWVGMIGPAEAFRRPLLKWAPVGFAAAYAAAVALAGASFQPAPDYDNNMAVENLEAGNLVVENDLSALDQFGTWGETNSVTDPNRPPPSIVTSPNSDMNSALENAERAIENASHATEEQGPSTAMPEEPSMDLANRLQQVTDANNRTTYDNPHQ